MRILIVCLFFCSSVIAQSNDILVKGRYSNYDYAYAVRIPKGRTGSQSPAPFPNHGFAIQLSKDANATLAVDASYNAALWESFDDAIEANKSYFKDEVGGEVSVVDRAPAVLGKLKAVRFTMKSKSENADQVREVLLAFREAPGEVGIVYEIVLTTSTARYDADKHVMNDLQKTWRLKSLPK